MMHGFRRIVRFAGPVMCAMIAFCVATLWSVVIPLGEAPDEPEHFAYVISLMEGHFPTLKMPTTREAFQPPLAYLVSAAVALPFSPPYPARLSVNPEASYDPATPRSRAFKAKFFHPPNQAYPWSGWTRLWHLLRIVSAAWLALAAMMAYLAARQLFPRSPALWSAVAAVTALLPQQVFIGMTVSNDVVALGLAALVVWFIAAMCRRKPTWGLAVIGGALAGLLILTKFSLIPFALLLISLPLVAHRRLDRSLGSAVIALLIWSPWAIRLWRLASDPTGLRINLNLHPTLRPPAELALSFWSAAFSTTSASLWGRFGWMNIALPIPVDGFATALVVVVLSLGILVGLVRRDRMFWAALAGVIIVTVGSWVTYLASVGGSAAQGRLLMICALPVALLAALPFAGSLQRFPAWTGWLVVVGSVVLDCFLLFWLVSPAYT